MAFWICSTLNINITKRFIWGHAGVSHTYSPLAEEKLYVLPHFYAESWLLAEMLQCWTETALQKNVNKTFLNVKIDDTIIALVMYSKAASVLFLPSDLKRVYAKFTVIIEFEDVVLSCITFRYLTHYSPVLLFYTHWKDQKTSRFSDVFRGYRKATPGRNGFGISG